ncbi:hypothetical protein JF770_16405 [Mycobacterium intracellulare]|uniref:hypothetical protein n=1 Tax=Mycobacterium intracellulare TaxID=1767 RepID=UPI001CD9BEA6|nr:hypothetical protein [Mycobacterium intracellulare]MCA2305147.1 hypothetical protein [Mycobacterium intracellulare]MCA2347491.1 hypothetical protein [Mycobacterium intracellulare]
MNQQLRENTLTAIAVVTAANEGPGPDRPLATQVANDWLTEHPGDGHTRLLNGLVQLSLILLMEIQRETDRRLPEVLMSVADLVSNWEDDEGEE